MAGQKSRGSREGRRQGQLCSQRRSDCSAGWWPNSPKPVTVYCNLVNHLEEQWGAGLLNQEVDLCLILVAPLQRAVGSGGARVGSQIATW